MPNWIQNGSIYYVQPTEPQMSKEEYRAYLDSIKAKLEEAKLKQKGMTA